MATQRQIEANQLNASRSTGPKTEEGKARSRLNSTQHGLAGGLAVAEDSPEFLDRRAKWAAGQKPVGEAANWALDRAVAATFRIERCDRALEAVVRDSRERALHCWEEDRATEAAGIAAGLARDPVLASRRLRTSLAGVGLLIEAWLGLIAALEAGRDWSEEERSMALDLLGRDPDLRSGRTIVDPKAGESPVAFRLELAFEELEGLEALRDESMAPLDESDRRRALQGDIAILSRPAKLVLRYEREAWRQYREAMAHLREPGSAPEPPKVVPPAEGPSSPVAEAAPVAKVPSDPGEPGQVIASGRSQFEGSPGVASGRSQFHEVSVGGALVDSVGATG